jgi:hypothetical protein
MMPAVGTGIANQQLRVVEKRLLQERQLTLRDSRDANMIVNVIRLGER